MEFVSIMCPIYFIIKNYYFKSIIYDTKKLLLFSVIKCEASSLFPEGLHFTESEIYWISTAICTTLLVKTSTTNNPASQLLSEATV